MKTLLFLVYKFLLMPLMYLLLQLVRPFSKGKLRELIDDKNKNFMVCKDTGIYDRHPIWIHAASGEIEYARSLIRELKTRAPQVPILVTYSSPSAKKILVGLDIDAWAALPWDFDFCFERFFKLWKPRALLVSRTDLWPVMAQFTDKKNIPSYLFSATFADNSSRLRGLTRYLTAFSLEKLNMIFCVSDEDASNLRDLKIKTPVQVIGDTRFDQVIHRLNHPKELKLSLQPKGFVFIMGSTWPEDEAVLVPAIAELKKSGVKFILAPHENSAEHLNQLQADLRAKDLTYGRYTQNDRWTDEDVLIIDQVGILAELYTWANVAFVGGSFRRQVHSVMESLAAGLTVLVGPYHQNNREALVYQQKHASGISLVTCALNSEDIVQHVKSVQTSALPELNKAVLLEVSKNQGSTQRLFEFLRPLL